MTPSAEDTSDGLERAPVTAPVPEAKEWDGGWSAHRRRQRDAWLATTPDQRLAWLEEAIAFAHRAGALPRRRDGD